MGALTGLKAFQDGKADEIAGIETPDDQTIVLKLDAPRGAIVAAALSMPASAPVPKEYAQKFDRKQPSAYGENQVATGPYMVENDESGKLTGYTPGTEIKLVRNPNWDAATDYKPAYVDSITIKEGNDPDVASRQILEGQSQISGDFQLPAPILKSVSQGDQKDLMELSPPTGRFRYIAFRTDRPPFDNADVRRALNAAIDKEALRQAFGGPITGDIPTHYIPPGQPGFDEAGGEEGTGADFMAQPSGNLELAKEYMKKAGYESGMYDGPQLTGVSDNATQQKNVTQVAVEQIKAARLRRQDALRRPRLDVHEVLPGAGQPARRLPERGLAEGLRRPRDAPQPGVQRQEHPRGGATRTSPCSTSLPSTSRWTRPRSSTIPPSATRRGARSTRRSPRRRPRCRGCGTRRRCSARRTSTAWSAATWPPGTSLSRP